MSAGNQFADQAEYDIRLEHGLQGLRALGTRPLRTIVVVDVLSFSTCVSVAVEREALIYPYPWDTDGSQAFAVEHQAILAGRRGDSSAMYSLSPESLMHALPGDRIVLPSPNGSAISLEAAGHAKVISGCLRNCRAVARMAASNGYPVAVIVAGERWPDGSLRPAIEDVLGAGAIVSALDGSQSPEAQGAAAVFDALRHDLLGTLTNSSSGRELVHRGYNSDVKMAAELDASEIAPLLTCGYFSAA